MRKYVQKWLCVCILSAIALCFGACTKIELTTQQNELIAQYIAGELYKYTYDFQNKYPDFYLINPEEPSEDETAVIQPTEEEQSSSTDPVDPGQTDEETTTAPAPSSIFDCKTDLDLSPVVISYSYMEIVESYDAELDGVVFGYITPINPNNVFLVVHFELDNPGLEIATITTMDKHPVFRMKFEDGTSTANSDNPYDFHKDLSNLKDLEIAGKGMAPAVLLFEVSPERAADLGTVTITIGESSIEIR